MIENKRKPVDECLRAGWRKVERDILALYDLPHHEGWEKVKAEINDLLKAQYKIERMAEENRIKNGR